MPTCQNANRRFSPFFRGLGGLAVPGITAAILLVAPVGCQSSPTTDPGPDYARPLPEGGRALRLVRRPELIEGIIPAYLARDPELRAACDASAQWFTAPSSREHFPFLGVTHRRSHASVLELRRLIDASMSPDAFRNAILERFEIYESVGWDGNGSVLFTGYYSPEFPGARDRSSRFRYPLYTRPADLVTEEGTGKPLGRRTASGGIEPYPTRREIDEGKLLRGSELVWVEDALSAYLIHVNGSAKIATGDGSVLYIGYDGKTDRPYASLGRAMVREGLLPETGVSIPAIRRVYRQRPAEVMELMNENESFVFFTEYDGRSWPSGSLGVRVHGDASLATDKEVFPRGGPVLVETTRRSFSGAPKAFQRFMLDQDTGGAIKAPGRADIFMGIGSAAGILAGEQAAEGRLYYLFLKPSYVPNVMAGVTGTTPPSRQPLTP